MKPTALLTAAALGLALASPLGAHPHIYIDTDFDLVFDTDGKLTAVRIDWAYDDFYSLLMIEENGLDADGDGTVTPEEMRSQLQAKLAEYDSDGDGTLSIAEFETLHSAMIREMMVDRFQHLDADGDGAVTAEEMAAPADMMERMQKMHSNMSQMQPEAEKGMDGDAMMNDN